MNRFRIIVKGAPVDAELACRERGFRFWLEREQKEVKHTHGMTDADELTLAYWFGEPGEPPYPAGALLFYSQAKHEALPMMPLTAEDSFAVEMAWLGC